MIEKHIAGGILLMLESTPLPKVLADSIKERWYIDEEDDSVDELFEKAASISNACVFLRPAQVESVTEDCVVLGSQTFISSLVAQKLHTPEMTVVGYVATCGRTLYEARKDYEDDVFLAAVWEDICASYLHLVHDMLLDYLPKNYFPAKDGKKMFASINPGSLQSWPIRAQKDLFAFLGEEGVNLTGVELTDSMLMLPTKSNSGIFFPTDQPYENCMHCPKINCPGRRAPYTGHE